MMTATGVGTFSIIAAHLNDDIRGLQSLIVVSLKVLLY